MTNERTKDKKASLVSKQDKSAGNIKMLSVTIMSFGYKSGTAPLANMVFDVRFLKNPFWMNELRPLNGLDLKVQEYVLNQNAAYDFLNTLIPLLTQVLPKFVELDIDDFSIALGCTGGQHRSVALVEALAKNLHEIFPDYNIKCLHRELDGVKL